MKTLTIRFLRTDDLVSRLIEWTTDSLWCHTEGLSRDGKSWVGAHAGTGIQARPLNWADPVADSRVYAVEVTDSAYELAMDFMESKIGTPYDYEDIVGLALHVRLNDQSRLDCSGFMLQWLMAAGLLPLNCLENYTYLITPETLHLSPLFIGKAIQL